MLLALRAFALTAGALQLLVAMHLARRQAGPFRLGAAALLVLNGLAAARLGLLGGVPGPSEHLFLLMDGATGPFLLATGGLALRFPDHDLRDRKGWALLAFGAAWAIAVPAYVLATQPTEGHLPPGFDLLHTLPALVGLGLAGVGLARGLAKARSDRAGEAALLGLGFLPTMAENAAAMADQVLTWANGADPTVGRVVGVAALFPLAATAVVFLARPSARNPRWRHLLLLVMVATGMAYFAYWDGTALTAASAFTAYMGTTVSFYILRPLGLGLAYARTSTLWTVFDIAVGLLFVTLGKAFSRAAFGIPLGDVGGGDALGFALALLATAFVGILARRARKIPERVDVPTTDELLARFLLDVYRRQGPDATVDKQQIEAATGIGENNLAAAVRRLERHLDGGAPPGTFVAEIRVGVRGRKRYRLTAHGLRALGPAPAPRTKTPDIPLASPSEGA